MAKIAKKHFNGDGWSIVEHSINGEFSLVSESIFSLGNEYMGARGFLDEGSSYPTLRDSYCNGVYEFSVDKNNTAYKGIATRTHYMVNACNFFDVEIYLDGERLDMAKCTYTNYKRTLYLKKGLLERKLTCNINGKKIKLSFYRFFDMQYYRRAYQRIVFESDCDVQLKLCANVHFNGLHWNMPSRWSEVKFSKNSLECRTESTSKRVGVMESVDFDGKEPDQTIHTDKKLEKIFNITLKGGEKSTFTRLVSLNANKRGGNALDILDGELKEQIQEGYDNALKRMSRYWKSFWQNSDIEIDGDDGNQQGIRFCIFQLQQTYHGIDASNNIGAKGLTGEAYSGNTFWDTETYCLPYYLYNNVEAARYLLEYRYATLDLARKRARDLDCEGACYPIATINGEEACTLWQHASLQMQPSTGVAYGIYHYYCVTHDNEFLYTHGLEMLIEICRYLATRGQWDQKGEYFGYYAVMGPDEFQMMVNHNTYTNYMAQRTFLFTLESIQRMPNKRKIALFTKMKLTTVECQGWRKMARKMKILYDPKTKLYEQHEGFYSLPHIDIDKIPMEEFPLYSHWSYDRIYRNDMIKQPDVLMFQLLYREDFPLDVKRKNYEYYEPRCIHESSLSPSVHSIIACEIGKKEEAVKFFEFASRLDLDNYNRNTEEGLHTTSIAAAWLNIVFGFGGLCDGKLGVRISPMIPDAWNRYAFNILIEGVRTRIEVDKERVTITADKPISLSVYGRLYNVDGKLSVKLKK